jgi:hypothetical protein
LANTCPCGVKCSYENKSAAVYTCENKCGHSEKITFVNIFTQNVAKMNAVISELIDADMLFYFLMISDNSSLALWTEKYVTHFKFPHISTKSLIYDNVKWNGLCTILNIPQHLLYIKSNTHSEVINIDTDPNDMTHVVSYQDQDQMYEKYTNFINSTNNSDIIMRYNIIAGIDTIRACQLYYLYLHKYNSSNKLTFNVADLSLNNVTYEYIFYASSYKSTLSLDVLKYIPTMAKINFELNGNKNLAFSIQFINKVREYRRLIGLNNTDIHIESLILSCLWRDIYCNLFAAL